MNTMGFQMRFVMKTATCLVFGLNVLLNPAGSVLAGGYEINTGYFGNVAIQGYDPVAYFTRGEAIKGTADHRHKWLGAYWWFDSEEHRQMFAANPQRYAPQYGGHCATGLAVHGGRTKDIDPEAWVIVDDKLYLNYSQETSRLLTEGVVTVERANANWIDVPAARN